MTSDEGPSSVGDANETEGADGLNRKAGTGPIDWELPNVADLSDIQLQAVLQHLNRNTQRGRDRAAADVATRSYLQAGLRLLSEAVSPKVGPPSVDPVSHPFVAWLSRSLIVNELANEPDPALPSRGSVNGLRDRWDPHSNYITDLLLVALTADNWSAAVSAGAGEHLHSLEDAPIQVLAQEIAYQDLVALRRAAGFRVQLLASAMAQNEPVVMEPLARMYEQITHSWGPVYEAALAHHGLSLRRGVSVAMLSDLFAALAEGLALRMIATTSNHFMDPVTRTSHLGVGVLAMLSALSTHGDDTRSLDEYLSEVFSVPEEGQATPG